MTQTEVSSEPQWHLSQVRAVVTQLFLVWHDLGDLDTSSRLEACPSVQTETSQEGVWYLRKARYIVA